jgi:hypothetical protein
MKAPVKAGGEAEIQDAVSSWMREQQPNEAQEGETEGKGGRIGLHGRDGFIFSRSFRSPQGQ